MFLIVDFQTQFFGNKRKPWRDRISCSPVFCWKLFLKISQSSQNNLMVVASFQKLCRPKKKLWRRFLPVIFFQNRFLSEHFRVLLPKRKLVEANPFRKEHSFKLKPFLLLETIPFSGNYFAWWKPFLLVEAVSDSDSFK